MLTEADIAFIRATRREIVTNRQHPVTLTYTTEGERDPWTDEPVEGEATRDVMSVVTEISSQAIADRQIINGVEVVEGDLWFSVDIDTIDDIFDRVTAAHYDDRDYTIIAQDKKGIGERNRVEFLGRRET